MHVMGPALALRYKTCPATCFSRKARQAAGCHKLYPSIKWAHRQHVCMYVRCLACSDEMSFLVLLEALMLFMVCSSSQLYTQQTAAPVSSHPLLESLMEQQQCTPALTAALLRIVVQQQAVPQKLVLFSPAPSQTAVMRLVRTAAGEFGISSQLQFSCFQLIHHRAVVNTLQCTSNLSLVNLQLALYSATLTLASRLL